MLLLWCGAIIEIGTQSAINLWLGYPQHCKK